MKADDAAPSGKHGDVSPLSGSLSNLAEGTAAESRPKRKAEPAFETLSNFSRVTPAQLPYLVFPPDGRYQPVRAVSTTTIPPKTAFKAGAASSLATKQMGGGGILVVSDQQPEEPAEFIPFTTVVDPNAAVTPAPVVDGAPTASQRHISLDENAPEVGPPGPFEVSFLQMLLLYAHRLMHFLSIHSIMTRKTQISCRLVLPNVRLLLLLSASSPVGVMCDHQARNENFRTPPYFVISIFKASAPFMS